MNKFRQVRKSKGLTLKQVAQSVGISEDLIGKYERGERNP
ncbi:MAG TPA: helix-turn-helix transcriptional regulator [Candidatus Coprovivens excrementavium]|nr:helix-turn-helix transcriptional regulator [Candidatus Coprovivens excrementavium]